MSDGESNIPKIKKIKKPLRVRKKSESNDSESENEETDVRLVITMNI